MWGIWQHVLRFVHFMVGCRSLVAERDFMRNIIDALADPVFVKDQHHRWVWGNQRFWELVGTGKEQMLLKTDYDVVPKDQADIFWEKDRLVLETGEVNENLEEFTSKDGTAHVLVTRKSRFLTEEAVPYLVGVIRDMTHVHEMQQSLAINKERLRLAKRAARFGIWDCDVQTGHLSWDEIMFEIYGVDPAHFTHSVETWENVLHPEDRQETIRHFRHMLEDPHQEMYETSFRILTQNREERYVQANGVIKRDANGKALRVVGLNYDVTHAKRMDTQLREHKYSLERLVAEQTRDILRAKERAEQANRAKSDFLSNMTHELRTPLNSIIGMTSLLMERDIRGQERSMLSVVHEASGILLELVNNILDMSKIEAGEITLEEVGFDLYAVVSRVLTTLRPLAERKGISLTESLPDEALPLVVGDPLRIGQVLTNMLSNAIKYTDTGGVTLRIRYLDPSQRQNDAHRIALRIEVEDTGVGIPPERQQCIFGKFTQADVSNARQYGGTGLGLAISKELVERMGGSIGVHSVPGQGSCFFVMLSLGKALSLRHEAPMLSRTRRPQRYAALASSEARMLVVEDNPLNQMLMRMMLEKYGFTQMELCNTGAAAVQRLQQADAKFDLILMDCYMPEMNGYDATRLIRKHESELHNGLLPAHIPIIAITANAMDGDEEKCLACGMDDYIAKPIQEKDFVEVLGQWVVFDLANNNINQATA